MKKFLMGSKLLNLNNCNDTDYLILLETEEEIKELKKDKNNTKEFDLHYFTIEDIKRIMKFSKDFYFNFMAYQLDFNIIKQNFPIEFHILEYKNELKNYLKWIVKNKKFNFNKNLVFGKNHVCSKLIYHIAYMTFILENNSIIITSKQKEIIQKIHDLKMSSDYLDELENKIDKL